MTGGPNLNHRIPVRFPAVDGNPLSIICDNRLPLLRLAECFRLDDIYAALVDHHMIQIEALALYVMKHLRADLAEAFKILSHDFFAVSAKPKRPDPSLRNYKFSDSVKQSEKGYERELYWGRWTICSPLIPFQEGDDDKKAGKKEIWKDILGQKIMDMLIHGLTGVAQRLAFER